MFEDNQPQQEQPVEQPIQPEQQQTPSPSPSQPPKVVEKPVQTSQDEKMWAAIGYIAFLGLVTMAMKPKSAFCRHHAAQGLVLFVLWFIGLILLAIGSFLSAIGGILMLGVTILAVLGIIKAISSYEFKVPVLSDIAKAVPVDAIVGSMTGKTPEQTPQTPTQAQAPAQPQTPEQTIEEKPPTQAPTQPQVPEQTIEEKPPTQAPAQPQTPEQTTEEKPPTQQ